MNGNQVDLGLSGSGTTICTVSTTGALYTVDVSNPAAPVLKGGAALSTYGAKVAVEGTIAVALSSNASITNLDVYNIANPAAVVRGVPVRIGPSTASHGIDLVNHTAYIAADTDGLLIYDVSNLSSPTLRSTNFTVGSALGVDVWVPPLPLTYVLVYVADFPATLDAFMMTP